MKKTIRLFTFFCLVALCSVFMVSCEQKPPVNPTPDENANYSAIIEYLGISPDDENVHMFFLQLVDSNIKIEDNKVTGGSGDIITLQIYSKDPGNSLLPEMTNYNVESTGKTGTILPGSMNEDQQLLGSYVETIKEDKSDLYFVEGGNMSISKNGDEFTVTMNITLNDNVKKEVTYKGSITVQDGSAYRFESKTPTNYEFTATKVTAEKSTQSVDAYDISMTYEEATNSYELRTVVFKNLNSQDATGSFGINDKQVVNTALLSFGGQIGPNGGVQLNPTYLVITNSETQKSTVYFVVSGNIQITKDKITTDFVSRYGTTIKVTYSGNIEY